MTKKNKLLYWDDGISQVENVVLRCFFPEGNEKTISELMERANYSYERVNTALKGLEDKKIVSSKRVGKTLVYKADYNNLYLKLAFHHYMTERLVDFANRHLLIYKSLKEISEETSGLVILFGSYSKGNETKDSDIDLIVISDSENQAKESVNKIKSTRGFDISLAFIKKIEFSKIRKENSALWGDLRDYAVIFNGTDVYYYWMY